MTALAPSGPRFTADGRRIYIFKPETQLAKFVSSNNFVDVIQGPLGSGKSVASCLRLMRHAQEQKPSPIDGMRRSRWFVARNTYPDLRRTTIRTWLECFPEHLYGRFFWGQPPSHRVSFADVRAEFDFLALDKPEDIRKLRSGEYTGGFFNEIQYAEKALFDEGQSRVDRYPSEQHGGATWAGVIADANAPDEDHWLGQMTGQVDLPPGLTPEEAAELQWPPNWGFFLQPPALIEKLDQQGRIAGYEVNPNAENLENLSKTYYERQIAGKTKAWIDSRLMVRVVLVVEGSPVFPMFRRETHIAAEPLRPVPGHAVTVGLDFGRQPAAIFMQAINNRVFVQYEILGFNEGAVTFAPKVRRFIAEHYPDHRLDDFLWFGDPKGQDKGQADERTAYDIFAHNGMMVRPAPDLKQNMIETRVNAVSHLLNDMHDGRPRAVFSPLCRTLNIGMLGRYHLVREQDGELKPKKDRYSNPADALQYGVLGLGEGRAMTGHKPIGAGKPVQAWKGRRSLRRVA
jgi:hypothetical protein